MEGISDLLKKSAGKKENKNIHSEAHALADEISTYFGEKKRFGMYLGIIKRVGVAQARAHFSRIRSESANVKDPRKIFMWMTRKTKPPEET